MRGWVELERTRDLFVMVPSKNFWSRERHRTPVVVVWLDGTVDSGQGVGRLGFARLAGAATVDLIIVSRRVVHRREYAGAAIESTSDG